MREEKRAKKEDKEKKLTKYSREKRILNTKLAQSAFVFAVCYVVFILFIVLMIVINNPTEWRIYFQDDFPRFLSLCICTLLLFYIVY